MQNLLLTFSDASTLSRDDWLTLSSAVSVAILENISRTAAVIDLLTIIQGPDFDTYVFNVQSKSVARCRNISDRVVKVYEQ